MENAVVISRLLKVVVEFGNPFMDVPSTHQALESDDLLALLALSEHGVAHLAEDGGLQLVVDDEGLLGGVDVEAARLHLPLQVLGVLRGRRRGRHPGTLEHLSLVFYHFSPNQVISTLRCVCVTLYSLAPKTA